MSADNWTKCPRCVAMADATKQEAARKVCEQYGKIPASDYLRLMREAAQMPDAPEDMFRENYELGVDSEGQFSVSYRGRCTKCNLEFKFKHEEKVKL